MQVRHIGVWGYSASAHLTCLLWQVRHIGIWGYSASDAPTISGVKLADFSIGLFWGGIGPDALSHEVRRQTLTLRDSLLVGRTLSNTVSAHYTLLHPRSLP